MKNERSKPVGEVCAEMPDYGELIIEMIGKVDNQGALKYLYTFIRLFLEKWG